MRVVIAPDKFKGTLSSAQAADSMRRAVEDVLPDAFVTVFALADGGEGTVDVLVASSRATLETRELHGDEFPVARLEDGSLCIEVATTSGRVSQPDAITASSGRTGDALRLLFSERPARVLVAVGGSNSTDGGVGLALSLGWRFLDERGAELGPGSLDRLRTIDGSHRLVPACPVVGLCDVANALVGPRGSARTFAPQKGASHVEVERLEAQMSRLSEVVRTELGIDIGSLPHSGAGGGIGAGLRAFCDAELADGFDFIASTIGLHAAFDGADLVITGEGRLDEGSTQGKVTSGVARVARERGIPVLAVCGEVALPEERLRELGFTAAVSADRSVPAAEGVERATRVALESRRV